MCAGPHFVPTTLANDDMRCSQARRIAHLARVLRRSFWTRGTALNAFIHNNNWLESCDPSAITRYFESRPRLVNPSADYHGYTSHKTDFSPILNTENPGFSEIIQNSYLNPPGAGSIIEYIDHESNTPKLGVVVQQPLSKFHENYSKNLVLSADNNLEYISTTSITFHVSNVVTTDLEPILEARFNPNFVHRLHLVLFLQQFAKEAALASETILPHMEIAFAQYAHSHSITSITLDQLVRSFRLPPLTFQNHTNSYLSKTLLLFALHIHMFNNPAFYLLLSSILPTSNIVSYNSSTALCRPQKYFVNSIANMDAITRFEKEFDVSALRFNSFLQDIHHQQLSAATSRNQNEINFFLDLWEGKEFKFLIEVLKFSVVYPHSKITSLLAQLPVFQSVTLASLLRFLTDIKVYDGKTDPFLSAHFVGEPLLSQLSATSVKDLTNVPMPDAFVDKKLQDHFPHLRKRSYYHDLVVYSLPSESGHSEIAISCEKLNSRKYRINIHVPDIVTKFPPSESMFEALSRAAITSSLLDRPLFRDEILKRLAFQEQLRNDKADFYSVGLSELFPQKKPKPGFNNQQTCLTLSFVYNTFESSPFQNLDGKFSFSFDSLDHVQIKLLSWDTLENCLLARGDLLPFTLFRRGKKPERSKLSDEDTHNIRFIYNIMKTHFKVRNIGLASNRDPNVVNNRSETLSVSFIDELDNFMGHMTSKYCATNSIPILSHCQDELERLEEEVPVAHNNALLPTYNANSYEQTLLARDRNGYVSEAASIIGRNWLGFSSTEVSSDSNLRHLRRGIIGGYVNMMESLQNYESILNQFQILSSVQMRHTNSLLHSDRAKHLSVLKSKGYNVNGPLSYSSLGEELTKIETSSAVCDLASRWTRHYWELQKLQESTADLYECIITDPGHLASELSARVAVGFCVELGIEVSVILPPEIEANIGSQKFCTVSYVQPVSGICAMVLSELV